MSITTKIKVGETAKTITLPEGKALTIKPTEGSSGTAGVAYLLDQALGGTNSKQSWTIGAGALPPITGYSGTQKILISCTAGSIDAVVGDAVLGSAPFDSRPSNFGQSTISKPRFPLLKWRASVQKARDGSAPAKIAFIGDSNTTGQGAATGSFGLVGARAKSYPVRAAQKLASVITCGVDGWMGDGNNPPGTYTSYDPRLVLGANASFGSTPTAFGGKFMTVTGPSDDNTKFTPDGQWDRVIVYTINAPSGASSGTIIKIDGIAVGAPINQVGASAVVATTFSAASLGAHTVTVNNPVAGTGSYILGMVCYNSAAPGAIMYQGGWNGGKVSDLANTTRTYSAWGALSAIQPHLTIINCTINDEVNSTPLANYLSNMAILIDRALLYGDVILLCGMPANATQTNDGTLDAMMSGLRDLCLPRLVNVIDQRDYLGYTWAEMNALGFAYDNNHLNGPGYWLLGSMAADAAFVL